MSKKAANSKSSPTPKQTSPGRKASKQVVHIQILQNGTVLSSTQLRLRSKGSLALTSLGDGPLALPHYPLPDGRLEFATFVKGGLLLQLSHLWEGFCTTNLQMLKIARSDKHKPRILLKPGDYASLAENDLRLLIRIGPPKPRERSLPAWTEAKSRSLFLHHFFPTAHEQKSILVASIMAVITLGGAFIGLFGRSFSRPEHLRDLSDTYILPFIAPEHLTTAPEALQEHLDRKHLVKSVLHYYEPFIATMLGQEPPASNWLFPSTVALYQRMFSEARQELAQRSDLQKDQDRIQGLKEESAQVVIPSAQGESMDGMLLRLTDKMKVFHESLAADLNAKRNLSEGFSKEPNYVWEDYKSVRPAAKNQENKLAGINVFGEVNDEEQMYVEAARVADKAYKAQSYLFRHLDGGRLLSEDSYLPVAMPAGIPFATFAPGVNVLPNDERLFQLQGLEYGQRTPTLARKPPEENLEGELEPALIERYIRENKYELQLCYELALRRNDGASGTMEWKWRIDGRGLIGDIALITSSIKDPRMTECIRNKISAWRFPRPRRGSVEVSYPFEFAPAKG